MKGLASIIRQAGRNDRGREPASPGAAAPDVRDDGLAAQVAAIDWYHTIDLPGGVTTPGYVDHRAQVGHYGLPDDMRGMRALDVATFDGFWAFEMERRGASVTAIDLASSGESDIPLRWRERMAAVSDVATGRGFRLASDALGSSVQRRTMSVYDLGRADPGAFDVVFVSDLLQHLRDPQRALERVYDVVADGGHAIVAEVCDQALDELNRGPLVRLRGFVDYAWSVPSLSALKLMLNVAGFNRVECVSRFDLAHAGHTAGKVVLKAYPWRPPGKE